jgi:hypothetical protein
MCYENVQKHIPRQQKDENEKPSEPLSLYNKKEAK